jgi:hypothetical protein
MAKRRRKPNGQIPVNVNVTFHVNRDRIGVPTSQPAPGGFSAIWVKVLSSVVITLIGWLVSR